MCLNYIKACSIIFLVYDCQNAQFFETIDEEIKKINEITKEHKCSKWLIANKSFEGNNKISTEEGMAKASEIDYQFMEVSAKTG